MLNLKKALILIIFVLAAESAMSSGGKIPVLVSVQPQAYFLKRIGGDRVSAQTLIPPGESPVSYAPSPKQISAILKAKIFFRARVPFEVFFLPKLKSMRRDMIVVDVQKEF